MWEETFRVICDSLFRITVIHSGGGHSATGFVIARAADGQTDVKLDFALATAEHVFQPLPDNENIFWKIEQFDHRGQLKGELQFASNLQAVGNSPIRANLVSDVGLLFSPPLDSYRPEQVHLADPRYAVIPGVKVGWAGFPGFVQQKLGADVPCYFEGVVSAVLDTVDTDGKLRYLVDGHGGQGVSGGPVWRASEETSEAEVIGICTGYLYGLSDRDPGLVIVEAVGPVTEYVRTAPQWSLDIGWIGSGPTGS